MKYLFILGRNSKLSIAEIKSFCKRVEVAIIGSFEKNNGLLLEVDKKIEEKEFEKLGGVISVGEVYSQGNFESVRKDLEKIELYFGASNKFNYILHDYAEEFYENFSDYLRKRFWSEKLKSTEKKPTGFLNTQEGERLRKVRSSKIDEQFFIFSREVEQMEDGTKEVYFGKIIFNCDYEGLEERDMEKPVRRSELAISPRISKIMINLSEVKKGPLLDSFCGVGVILFEALLQNLSVVGVDIDKSAIGGAKENLAWGKFDRKKYSLIANDSKKVKIDSVEVLVAEPNLGSTLRKVLTQDKREREKKVKIVRKTYPLEKAKAIFVEFENLMIDVLNNLKDKISGKIVFSAPLIKTKDKRISCDIQKICERTELNLVEGYPIEEYRPGKPVGRDIIVLYR